jgi:hypothetical protein
MHRENKSNLHLPSDPNLGVVINLPDALKGKGVNGLPPYARVTGYEVDKYPRCPATWTRGPGSYFVPVKDGKGMWLDFNQVSRHPHHVAVIVSIQGINPLTGRKADVLDLERYDDKAAEPWIRGYQNYLSTVASPQGMLWIDGFRAEDGTVRQYVFMKDEKRGVAAQLIGVDRVFAIGVAFFTSKEPKPPQPKDTTAIQQSWTSQIKMGGTWVDCTGLYTPTWYGGGAATSLLPTVTTHTSVP